MASVYAHAGPPKGCSTSSGGSPDGASPTDGTVVAVLALGSLLGLSPMRLRRWYLVLQPANSSESKGTVTLSSDGTAYDADALMELIVQALVFPFSSTQVRTAADVAPRNTPYSGRPPKAASTPAVAAPSRDDAGQERRPQSTCTSPERFTLFATWRRHSSSPTSPDARKPSQDAEPAAPLADRHVSRESVREGSGSTPPPLYLQCLAELAEPLFETFEQYCRTAEPALPATAASTSGMGDVSLEVILRSRGANSYLVKPPPRAAPSFLATASHSVGFGTATAASGSADGSLSLYYQSVRGTALRTPPDALRRLHQAHWRLLPSVLQTTSGVQRVAQLCPSFMPRVLLAFLLEGLPPGTRNRFHGATPPVLATPTAGEQGNTASAVGGTTDCGAAAATGSACDVSMVLSVGARQNFAYLLERYAPTLASHRHTWRRLFEQLCDALKQEAVMRPSTGDWAVIRSLHREGCRWRRAMAALQQLRRAVPRITALLGDSVSALTLGGVALLSHLLSLGGVPSNGTDLFFVPDTTSSDEGRGTTDDLGVLPSRERTPLRESPHTVLSLFRDAPVHAEAEDLLSLLLERLSEVLEDNDRRDRGSAEIHSGASSNSVAARVLCTLVGPSATPHPPGTANSEYPTENGDALMWDRAIRRLHELQEAQISLVSHWEHHFSVIIAIPEVWASPIAAIFCYMTAHRLIHRSGNGDALEDDVPHDDGSDHRKGHLPPILEDQHSSHPTAVPSSASADDCRTSVPLLMSDAVHIATQTPPLSNRLVAQESPVCTRYSSRSASNSGGLPQERSKPWQWGLPESVPTQLTTSHLTILCAATLSLPRTPRPSSKAVLTLCQWYVQALVMQCSERREDMALSAATTTASVGRATSAGMPAAVGGGGPLPAAIPSASTRCIKFLSPCVATSQLLSIHTGLLRSATINSTTLQALRSSRGQAGVGYCRALPPQRGTSAPDTIADMDDVRLTDALVYLTCTAAEDALQQEVQSFLWCQTTASTHPFTSSQGLRVSTDEAATLTTGAGPHVPRLSELLTELCILECLTYLLVVAVATHEEGCTYSSEAQQALGSFFVALVRTIHSSQGNTEVPAFDNSSGTSTHFIIAHPTVLEILGRLLRWVSVAIAVVLHDYAAGVPRYLCAVLAVLSCPLSSPGVAVAASDDTTTAASPPPFSSQSSLASRCLNADREGGSRSVGATTAASNNRSTAPPPHLSAVTTTWSTLAGLGWWTEALESVEAASHLSHALLASDTPFTLPAAFTARVGPGDYWRLLTAPSKREESQRSDAYRTPPIEKAGPSRRELRLQLFAGSGSLVGLLPAAPCRRPHALAYVLENSAPALSTVGKECPRGHDCRTGAGRPSYYSTAGPSSQQGLLPRQQHWWALHMLRYWTRQWWITRAGTPAAALEPMNLKGRDITRDEFFV